MREPNGSMNLGLQQIYNLVVQVNFVSTSFMLVINYFLWRVRSWLRMNAGGMPNTCKSIGKALWGTREADG